MHFPSGVERSIGGKADRHLVERLARAQRRIFDVEPKDPDTLAIRAILNRLAVFP